MFGVLKPCTGRLSCREKREYKSYYCGLCMGLGAVSGRWGRMLTSYDLTLAYLVADSAGSGSILAEDGNELSGSNVAGSRREASGGGVAGDKDAPLYITCRCPFHPLRKVRYRNNRVLMERFAALNVILAYCKAQDDVEDEGGWRARLLAHLLRRMALRVQGQKGNIAIINSHLEELGRQEEERRAISLPEAAEPFAAMLSDILEDCLADPIQDHVFRRIGYRLGQWIYICDACLDVYDDARSGNYNPILAGREGGADEIVERRRGEILVFLMDIRRDLLQLVVLLQPSRNEELIHKLFSYMLPVKIYEMLVPGGKEQVEVPGS